MSYQNSIESLRPRTRIMAGVPQNRPNRSAKITRNPDVIGGEQLALDGLAPSDYIPRAAPSAITAELIERVMLKPFGFNRVCCPCSVAGEPLPFMLEAYGHEVRCMGLSVSDIARPDYSGFDIVVSGMLGARGWGYIEPMDVFLRNGTKFALIYNLSGITEAADRNNWFYDNWNKLHLVAPKGEEAENAYISTSQVKRGNFPAMYTLTNVFGPDVPQIVFTGDYGEPTDAQTSIF